MSRFLALSFSSVIGCLFCVPHCHAVERALLVGVSHYPNLPEKLKLVGAANDVVLVESRLGQALSEAGPTQIHVLSEAEGEQNANLLPTRANIASAFQELIESSQAGDKVVVFISGHGSQQPTRRDSSFPEPDGLDEIFLSLIHI